MPHCIIEYSQDIEAKPTSLINAVFQGALKSQLFEENHIKTRTIAFDNYQVGALKESFIHVTARILSGRTVEQRSMLSQSILTTLAELNLSSVTMTVEVVEMERDSYAKKIT